ncbi:hypothetical protein I4U23_018831 [Adineta vaga]|nr:hypothetical protein I4U23_018831 [Adineta vaga]
MMQIVGASDKLPDIGDDFYHDDNQSTLSFSTQEQILSEDLPPLEIVREMIKYETTLRLSEPIQDLFDLYHQDDKAITMVLDFVQKHVVEHFGYKHVNALRTAVSRFPDDPVIKEAFYIKHNKITQGLVNQGQCVQDVNLFTVDGQPTTLFSQISPGQPLVLLAGSTT